MGGPETVRPSLGAPGDWAFRHSLTTGAHSRVGVEGERGGGTKPAGEPTRKRVLTSKLAVSSEDCPRFILSLWAGPREAQLLRAGPAAREVGAGPLPGGRAIRSSAGGPPPPTPLPSEAPGRLPLGWGWGRRSRVPVLGVWNNDGGVTVALPVSSFS